MRIGIFTDTYPPYINGVSTSIAMLQHALEKLGHEVYIVTVNPENMKYQFEDDGKIIRIPGVPIGIYDYRLTGIYPIRAIETIKKWNLDIIHSHTEFGIGTFARINNNTTNVYIIDKDNNILYQTKVISNILKDNLLYTIENIDLKIKEGDELYLKIESMDDDKKNFIALYTIPPNIEAPMKLINENNKNEETRQDSLFYAINGNVSVEVFANIKYKDILQGSTYKVIEDNKSIRNSKILFYIIWFGLVTSFVLLISAIIEYIMGLNKKRKEDEINNSDTMLQ